MPQRKGPSGTRTYSLPFLGAYFFYYGGYCIFSSYIVMYLTHMGYRAVTCGLITSLTLMANLLMEPVGGYITDTFLSTRRYLAVCVGLICALCLFCTWNAGQPWLCLPAMVLTAGLSYPFSQLLDAWVNCSRSLDQGLVYSRIRAGGSIGYAVTSIAAGYYFQQFGWSTYFLAQAVFFLAVLPFLAGLPEISLENSPASDRKQSNLSPLACVQIILHSRPYILCLVICTVYWFSHRPVGSYLSLIVEARSGDPGTYGSVCGVGAATEFLGLLALGATQRRRSLTPEVCIGSALGLGILRPLCILMFPGVWPLYLGQILQSLSFALFYTGSVEWFTRTAHPRIRSFCISVGLTVSSVGGTIAANLLGGGLCDWLGPGALLWLSLAVSIGNGALFLMCRTQKTTPYNCK